MSLLEICTNINEIKLLYLDSPKSEDVPQMSAVHDSGVILREDFENDNVINPVIWSEINGGDISDQCGSVLHGKAANFCGAKGPRSLVINF